MKKLALTLSLITVCCLAGCTKSSPTPAAPAAPRAAGTAKSYPSAYGNPVTAQAAAALEAAMHTLGDERDLLNALQPQDVADFEAYEQARKDLAAKLPDPYAQASATREISQKALATEPQRAAYQQNMRWMHSWYVPPAPTRAQ